MSVQVDHAEIKLGQILTMAMSVAAFTLSEPKWLMALGAIFLVTALFRPLSPFYGLGVGAVIAVGLHV